ncbi:MAG TPA: polysaccharide deacetylase family protein [Candidatus Acidoferrales bacterium]|nr:polysaccharide deacetylase family protein [Candidatus Acidoferrales bacterium]
MFRRSPVAWPQSARVAFTVCVVMETWPEDAGATTAAVADRQRMASAEGRSTKNITSITERQYGERVGVYRLLNVLKDEGLKASFFVNGRTVDAFPELMKRIIAEGHELGSGSWQHHSTTVMSREEQHSGVKRAVDAFQRHLGFRPLGFAMTGERPTDDTPRVLADLGYKYWMAFLHEDLPYVLSVARAELVIVPSGAAIADQRPGHVEPGANPHELFRVWKDNFDWLYEEGKTYPGFMNLVVHPFVTGRPFAAALFRDFLRHVKSHPDVWLTRGIDLANYWLENWHDHLIEKWPNYGTGLAYAKTLAR